MTGSIKVDNITLARHLRDDSNFNIYGGTGIGNGARISLAGKDHRTNPGLLLLEAHNGDLSTRLALRPDGRIYIYDEVDKTYTHLVRSVNGLSANSSGNVALASVGKLTTARTITLADDCSGSVQFDGSSNVTLSVTVQDNSHMHSIDNITGLQEALEELSGYLGTFSGFGHAVGEYPPVAAMLQNDSGIAHIEKITLDRKEQHAFEIVTNTPSTKEDQIKIYKNATSQYIDKIAQTRDYDNACACLSYLNSTNETWKHESVIFNEWRDNVWNKAYELINTIENNEISPLNINDFISQLPLIDWDKNI